MDFVEAMRNRRHPRHRDLTEWYGGPFDAECFDLLPLKLRLGDVAKRRHAGKISYAKRKAET